MGNYYKFLNIGFGDTYVLHLGSKIVMVDCYEDDGTREHVANHIPGGVIDVLILTHRHFDHYYGIQALLDNNISVREVWETCWVRKEDDQSIDREQWQKCQGLVDQLESRGAMLRKLSAGTQPLSVENCNFYVLNPPADTNEDASSELHDGCLVLLLESDGQKEILFCGDAYNRVLDRVADTCDVAGTRILTASHHGALDSVSEKLLDRVRPEYTVISNTYGTFGLEQQEEAIRIYRKYSGKGVLCTYVDGTIVIDG